jgi:HD-GYP domain-containing protein (c-di-GMP phosphodiesterase class II)
MTHPIIGACIAGSLIRDKRIIEIIQYHHARYDGKGLRQTIEKDKIPLLARIIALADAYDAMTSNRSYRNAFPGKRLWTLSTRSRHHFDLK